MSPRIKGVSRTPVAVQLAVLMLVGLALCQALTFAVVLLVPPPRPPIARLSEVARALKGGDLRLTDGRLLIRSTDGAPPPDNGPGRRNPFLRQALAELSGARPQDIRLSETPPGGHFMIFAPGTSEVRVMHSRMLARHAAPGAPAEPPPEGAGPPVHPGPMPPGAMADLEFHMRMAPGAVNLVLDRAPLVGDFTAARRMADGRWLIVRPPPEPFPTDWQLRLMVWLLGCVAIIVGAAYLFGRRITAPIGAFAAAADRLGRDPRQEPMPLKGPAEIGRAAAAFNRMQERLRRYVEDRTAMVGAISHDLRTPLARIRFKLENAPPDLKEDVGRDIDRMQAMIDSVLAFIRDASEPSRRERLDLLSLVECAVDDAALVGAKVAIIGDPAPLEVEADASALQRLFGNLVDNAVKHAGGAEVTLGVDDDCAVVEILDEGPSLPAADLERVFQPFYRAEAARTLTDDGMGLGLAVARSIARAHGGDVTLSPRTPKGLVARVTLPLAATVKARR